MQQISYEHSLLQARHLGLMASMHLSLSLCAGPRERTQALLQDTLRSCSATRSRSPRARTSLYAQQVALQVGRGSPMVGEKTWICSPASWLCTAAV